MNYNLKQALLPLIEEANSKPCQFCGGSHRLSLSDNPAVGMECSEDSCALWMRHFHDRAKAVLATLDRGNFRP